MKKLTLILLAFTAIFNLHAQTGNIRYQGDVNVGYSPGVGDIKCTRVNVQMVNSARIGDYFSVGVGVGVDIYTKVKVAGYEETGSDVAVPVFFNARGYPFLLGDNSEFYLSADIGGSIGVGDMSGLSGLLFVPSIGARFKIGGTKAITVGFGYAVQQWSESGVSINTNAVQIKLGLSF